MDQTMTQNAIRLLKYIPILFLWNGYWMLSNKQMFGNTVNKIELSSQQMEASHTFSSLWDLNATTPMLFFCGVNLIIGFLRTFFSEKLSNWGFTGSECKIEVDENLPDFFNALKLRDKEWFLTENEYNKKKYRYMVANQETIDTLKRYPATPPKPITNIAFYYILANPYYQRQLNYFTVALPNREDYIIDDDSDEENDCEQSDLVSIMLNLAYLKQEYAE